MMHRFLLLLGAGILLGVCNAQQQFVYNGLVPPPPAVGMVGVVYESNAADPRLLAHPAVVENAARDAQLPGELTNDFYKNPRIADGLARASWFGDKEFPTFNRQADKISREEIAKIIRRIEHMRRRRAILNF